MPPPLDVVLTTDPSLRRQQRALLVPGEVLDALGIRPGSLASVHVGSRARGVWVHLNPDAGARHDVALRLDARTASALGVEPGGHVAGRLDAPAVLMTPQPMRLDYPQAANRVVVSARVAADLGLTRGRVVLRSATRTMTATAWSPPDGDRQSDDRVRLNYHARLLLGIAAGGDERVQLSPWPDDRGGRPVATLLRAAAQRVRLRLGAPVRFWLGAPSLSLAVRSAASIDDGQRVARCSAATFDLLGAEPGDRVRVSWGARETSVRLFARPGADLDLSAGPAIVDWSTGRTDDEIPDDSTILVPAAVRAELGAPRDGVVDIRRSTAWLVRKRAVALTLPLIGVAVSVAGLSLPAEVGAILLVVATLMTLARDRVPRVRSTVALDG